MVESDSERLNAVFHALADPTRRAMLQSLTTGDRNISELAAPFDMSLEAASKHVKVLERAGMIRRSIKGRTHVCRLDAQPMHGGLEWIRHYERFWSRRLDKLEELLETEDRIARKSRTSKKARRKR
ncbi:MAG: metalloregulator ArsR/SmtB family transcription factor [Gammaproteobacteria bacterium]|nr:metalloregulator ArsR/SmtB family transcription factor [Gammaproteobacteria bacterium]MDH4314505.1 metalloregulator ArsR/SmtB family transcription factor [Gammaproteobacteria bacterium]MDH5215375.1 metalloregulator ArsR/SmtB family transcription factor [Gammaproteobacteria bacterium]